MEASAAAARCGRTLMSARLSLPAAREASSTGNRKSPAATATSSGPSSAIPPSNASSITRTKLS
jgi:hypothetical protein